MPVGVRHTTSDVRYILTRGNWSLATCTASTTTSLDRISDPRPPTLTIYTSASLLTARPRLATDSCATRLGSPKALSTSRSPSGSRTGTREPEAARSYQTIRNGKEVATLEKE